jgi:hypothetical protein
MDKFMDDYLTDDMIGRVGRIRSGTAGFESKLTEEFGKRIEAITGGAPWSERLKSPELEKYIDYLDDEELPAHPEKVKDWDIPIRKYAEAEADERLTRAVAAQSEFIEEQAKRKELIARARDKRYMEEVRTGRIRPDPELEKYIKYQPIGREYTLEELKAAREEFKKYMPEPGKYSAAERGIKTKETGRPLADWRGQFEALGRSGPVTEFADVGILPTPRGLGFERFGKVPPDIAKFAMGYENELEIINRLTSRFEKAEGDAKERIGKNLKIHLDRQKKYEEIGNKLRAGSRTFDPEIRRDFERLAYVAAPLARATVQSLRQRKMEEVFGVDIRSKIEKALKDMDQDELRSAVDVNDLLLLYEMYEKGHPGKGRNEIFEMMRGPIEKAGLNIEELLKLPKDPYARVTQTLGMAGAKSSGGSILGSFEEGTAFVPQTGLYELHRGEAVVPETLNQASSDINFDDFKSAVDELKNILDSMEIKVEDIDDREIKVADFPEEITIVDIDKIPTEIPITGIDELPTEIAVTGADDLPREIVIVGAEDLPDEIKVTGADDLPQEIIVVGADTLPSEIQIVGVEDLKDVSVTVDTGNLVSDLTSSIKNALSGVSAVGAESEEVKTLADRVIELQDKILSIEGDFGDSIGSLEEGMITRSDVEAYVHEKLYASVSDIMTKINSDVMSSIDDGRQDLVRTIQSHNERISTLESEVNAAKTVVFAKNL